VAPRCLALVVVAVPMTLPRRHRGVLEQVQAEQMQHVLRRVAQTLVAVAVAVEMEICAQSVLVQRVDQVWSLFPM
jgi:hypothetical protein